MKRVAFLAVLAFGGVVFLTASAKAENCENAEFCPTVCPSANSCSSEAECEPGMMCQPFGPGMPCIPSECGCDPGSGAWICTSDCSGQCMFQLCGNGVLDPAEECDDGGESATCDADCTFAECGDETRNATAGEACDGDDDEKCNGLRCRSNCTCRLSKPLRAVPRVSVLPPGMVFIPGGEFQMGDSFDEGESDELPVHTVYLSPFSIGRYAVTKGLWDTVRTWATSNGYDDLIAGYGKAAGHPVHGVNWFDCVKWCNARSRQEGRTPCYYTDAGLTTVYTTGEVAPYVKWDANGYRLPTEAEWEKAARGGTPGHRFPWSDTDTIQHARANYYSCCYAYDTSPTSDYHPCWGTGGHPFTSPVGFFTGALQYKADWGWPGTPTSYQTTNSVNGYGLHDMSGNVWEWCNDCKHSVNPCWFHSSGVGQSFWRKRLWRG